MGLLNESQSQVKDAFDKEGEKIHMYKQVIGFDPEILTFGLTITINDSNQYQQFGKFIFLEREDDYYRQNLSGNYLIRDCTTSELHVINSFGKEYKIPLKHINGCEPRLTINIIG